MLLTANGTRVRSGPNRYFSGTTTVAGGHANEILGSYGRNNWFAGPHSVAGVTDRSAKPEGARHPVAWLLPMKSGGLASRYESGLVTSASASGALGRNIAGETAFTLTVDDAALELVVSASGEATISFTTSGELSGAISASGTTTFSLTVSAATLGAISDLQGSSTFTLSAEGTIRAIGHMSGTTEVIDTLSPAALADAVGNRIIEAGYTFDQIVRILASRAAGAATGLEGPNPQFYGLDGTTVRIDGSYSAGDRTIDALNVD